MREVYDSCEIQYMTHRRNNKFADVLLKIPIYGYCRNKIRVIRKKFENIEIEDVAYFFFLYFTYLL